jgi:predicted AlkP superfamily phosphohydrolase/phosphomutase
MIEKGELPTFKRLIETSAYGRLKSTIPPTSSPAWVSFATGKNPGKHGIFDFVERSLDDYNLKLINSSNIQTELIWEMIGKYNKKSIVINLPPFYPPQKINGIMITGMLSPFGSCISYPEKMQQKLENKLSGYKLDIDWTKIHKRELIFKDILDVSKKRLEATIYLMENYSWDLFITIFTGSDRLQHIFWGEKEKILAYFKFLDKAVEEIEQRLEKDTLLIIMSDHGFSGATKTLYLNSWLQELSLLKRKPKKDGFTDYASWLALKKKRDTTKKLRIIRVRVKQFMERIFLALRLTKENMVNFLNYFSKEPENLISKRLFDFFPETNKAIDWENTHAYLASSNQMEGININMRNREPYGIVNPGEDYRQYRQLIIQQLKEWRDPDSGEKVIGKIFKREKLYSGPWLYKAPDILFIPNKYNYIISSHFRKNAIIKNKKITGRHSIDGMILIKGTQIQENKKIEKANIMDITPTILYFFQLPIPDDLDGEVIDQAFKPGYLKNQSIRYRKQIVNRSRRNFDYSNYEEKQIKNRLKGLGYI